MIIPFDHYGVPPNRDDLFVGSLYVLLPKEQYYALTDLCLSPPPMKYPVPSDAHRQRLNASLHSFLNPTPIGLSYSRLREHVFREDWYIAYNRIQPNPSAAVTAARVLVETVFKTIVQERGGIPDRSGDLMTLLKQAQGALNFQPPRHQAEHEIIKGLSSIINGVASLSNLAGDRHGLAGGLQIEDRAIAELVVHACGTIGLCFIEQHLLTPMVKP